MISAFDLDGTLLSVNSSYAFAKYLRRRGKFSNSSFAKILYYSIKHTFHLLPLEDLHHQAFNNLFFGKDQRTIYSLASQFVDEHLDKLLYMPVVMKLQAAQRAGHVTAILSSSPDFLVDPIAKKLGIERTLGTHYAVDKDGRFCKIESIVLGNNKADYLRVICDEIRCSLHDVTAYSDSHYDIDFLASAGCPIGVNPNRKLRSHCKKNGWTIL